MSPSFGLKRFLCAWETHIPFKPWNIDSAGVTYLRRRRVTSLIPRLSVTRQSRCGCLPPAAMGAAWTGLTKVWEVEGRHVFAGVVCVAPLSHSTWAPPAVRQTGTCVDQPVLSPSFFTSESTAFAEAESSVQTPVWFLA